MHSQRIDRDGNDLGGDDHWGVELTRNNISCDSDSLDESRSLLHKKQDSTIATSLEQVDTVADKPSAPDDDGDVDLDEVEIIL